MVNKWINKKIFFLFGICLLLILPLPFHAQPYIINLLVLSLIWGIVALAWDLCIGYGEIFSFGQLAFFVIGGYTSAMVAIFGGISPWISILIGGLVTGVVGVIIGLPCLRLKGIYVAMVTFALHLVLPTLILSKTEYTGGSFGLLGLPILRIAGYSLTTGDLTYWYYLTLSLSMLFLFVIYRIISSSIGLAFVALRDAEPFARSLGINTYKYKLIMLGVSAHICGTIGGFYGYYQGTVSPATLSIERFLLTLTMIMLGGSGQFPGPFIGGFIVTIINGFLIPIGAFRLLIFGAVVVFVMLYLPRGVIAIPEYFKAKATKSKKKP